MHGSKTKITTAEGNVYIYARSFFFNGGASAVANSYLGGRSICVPQCQQKGTTTTTSSCMRRREGSNAARIGREYGGPYPPCVRRRTDGRDSFFLRKKQKKNLWLRHRRLRLLLRLFLFYFRAHRLHVRPSLFYRFPRWCVASQA